jgi:ribonucleotide reductase alpha subunit
LNKIIDINYYPVPETKVSNLSERPIGIGVQGLADVFFKLKVPFDSDEAFETNKRIFETIYFAALTESCALAKKDGPYPTYKGSPISNGILQMDMWTGNEKDGKNEGSKWNWEQLRADIKTYGVRNSLVTALMPTASTAQIMGSVEAFEPITSNVYKRRVLAGEFVVFNRYLSEDLIKENLWSEGMKNELIKNKGSIQNIAKIPQKLKAIYKTVWEIKQRVLIDMAADRGPYVDQSQSLNLFFENPEYNLLTSAHFHGFNKGLKTGSYYIRSKPAASTESFVTKLAEEQEQEKQEQEKIIKKERKSEKEKNEKKLEKLEQKGSAKKEEIGANCDMCSG